MPFPTRWDWAAAIAVLITFYFLAFSATDAGDYDGDPYTYKTFYELYLWDRIVMFALPVASGALIFQSYRTRKTQRKREWDTANFPARIVETQETLRRGLSLLVEIQSELNARSATLDRLLVEVEVQKKNLGDNEALAEIKDKEAKAVTAFLDARLAGMVREGERRTVLREVTLFLLGIPVGVIAIWLGHVLHIG